MNGNLFKGNTQKKKGGRARKEVYCDTFDSTTDHYGKVVNLEGGKGVSVLLLDSIDGKPVHVTIRGIHHKKVWFKKEDLVVVRGSELWGKVSDSEANRVRRNFDRLEGKGDSSSIIFRDTNELDDDDEDDEDEYRIRPQPNRNLNPEPIIPLLEDGDIDIDAI
jgi:translation initiation factor IF-1